MTNTAPKTAGRPKKPDSMTPAQRKTKERARIRTLAESGNPEHWEEKVCIFVLSSSQFSDERRRHAWNQLGHLNKWISL